ncbi:hypothetical protein BASA81_007434 [Batrachochytrium salamandrivorans]|nr:hypothetical protein BASA81_007434 [Batrachochytrium salamandrivorans]
MKTLVADNGAFTLRLGLAGEAEPTVCMPHQTALIRNDVTGRELVGEETEDVNYAHRQLELFRAHERGCLVDKQVEEKVWTRAINQTCGALASGDSLLVTEAPLVPQTSRRLADELFFEHFNFARVGRVLPHTCAVWGEEDAVVKVVVDCGYSATWIVPLLGGNPVLRASSMRRLDVGGKLLTNLFKEELSWRHVNLMDDTKLVEDCKTACCVVKPLVSNFQLPPCRFLLPDFKQDFVGRCLAEHESVAANRQVMKLGALERTNLPEVLFTPQRIGMEQMGLGACIRECIASLPFELQTQARNNIVVTGGGAKFPGFCPRLEQELDCTVVDKTQSSLLVWRGAAKLAESASFAANAQTKQQYEEDGPLRSQKGRTKQQHRGYHLAVW